MARQFANILCNDYPNRERGELLKERQRSLSSAL